MKKIQDIAKLIFLKESELEYYGKYMAKINKKPSSQKGKLILVSAINPTSAGEGKTTISIGLADAIRFLGGKSVLALREPSLGPVFGLKGGAVGGGNSTIIPSENINLHFTGDIHAVTSANNLLCAMIDNHIFYGNKLGIDENKILFHRCLDINDRALREITISQEKLARNVEREESFTISAASEIMAILCLAQNMQDLKKRLGNIIVAISKDGKFIYAKDLHAEGAMCALLKDALKPNLVQSSKGTPAIVHGGPFANIAHGCNSIIATRLALAQGDYVITEAGFGGDLGGEKFFDCLCQLFGLEPSCVVIVVTVKALFLHGEGDLSKGLDNLEKHIENFKNIFNQNVVVAINKFDGDKESDIQMIKEFCSSLGVPCEQASPYSGNEKDNVALAKTVMAASQSKPKVKFAYSLDQKIENKIYDICTKIYGAKDVQFSPKALESIEKFQSISKGYPVIIAKTQYSLSDNDKLLARPRDFVIHIQDVEIKNGAKFLVAKAGNISLMPGLPKEPNACFIDVTKSGKILNIK